METKEGVEGVEGEVIETIVLYSNLANLLATMTLLEEKAEDMYDQHFMNVGKKISMHGSMKLLKDGRYMIMGKWRFDESTDLRGIQDS